jgi:hypothetical protein
LDENKERQQTRSKNKCWKDKRKTVLNVDNKSMRQKAEDGRRSKLISAREVVNQVGFLSTLAPGDSLRTQIYPCKGKTIKVSIGRIQYMFYR